GTLTINKAQATVTANSDTTIYNGTEQSVSGFTVDGLVNGEDASVLSGVSTSGGKGTNAGSYVLTVGGGSSDNYELSFVDGALTINKAQATVTANSDTTTYNGTEQSGSGFTVDGLVKDEDQSVLTDVTVNGGGRNAGSYVLTASGSDGNYALTFVDGTLTINKAQATVTANSDTSTYNGIEQSVSGFTVDGLVNGEDASVLSGVTTSGGKGTNAGSYVLTVGGDSSDNYELTFVDGTLTINKAQATVTANSDTTIYNGTEQSVSGFTVDGLVNGEDASVLSGVSTSGGKGTNAGSYVLTVGGGSSDNYELSFVDGALTINKAQATVTANSDTTTYNGTEQSGSGFTVDGLVKDEDQSVLTDVTVNGGGRNAGSYVLTASGSDGNYALTFVDGTLTINKAQATVTANSDTSTYNGIEQSVSGFTVDGLVNGEDKSVLTGVTTSGGKGTNAGSYVLTASGSDGNYELTFVDGSLTIERKTITADVQAQDKQFDGMLTAVLEGVLNGTISGDDVALQLSGLFASLTPGENRVLVDASLAGADAGNYDLVAPDSVTASLLGFVQTDDYQSAIVSQPSEQRRLSAPTYGGYVLKIDDDALGLSNSGQ
ncbi:MAG: hypothetical protein GYB41_14565, partial [Oceanospirillales bacterium]|nr:hypothetical protein [Oceanospirillales bacterium]